MQVIQTIQETRAEIIKARQAGKKIGLVPTMGALHAGHISLIEAAVNVCNYVAVSIFVNPTQFSPNEDFNKYPRPIEKDLQICQQNKVDLVFNPTPQEMYPDESLTWVTVEKLTGSLCGESRPNHFRGVTTICTKLFNIIGPDIAFFGQKDAQQAIVIERMVQELNMPLEIVICPTVRQSDGLALSSRNKYLSETQRKEAVLLYQALQKSRQLIENGITDSKKIIAEMEKIIKQIHDSKIDYISIVDARRLTPLNIIKGRVLIALAVYIGSTRLIDNILLDTQE